MIEPVRRNRMARACRKSVAALIAVASLVGSPLHAAGLPRVASASICADQFVLALADLDQIASVSEDATGPTSYFVDRARGLPVNHGAVEEFLAGDVDLVVMERHTSRQLEQTLSRFEIESLILPVAPAFDDVLRHVRMVADAIGQPRRGDAMISDIEHRLKRLAAESRSGPSPRVLFFRPDGGGAGVGTSVHSALKAAGFINLQADLGYDGWRSVPLEQMVISPPEGLVTSFFDTSPAAISRRFGHHSLFRALSSEKPRIPVAGHLWPCAGPMLIEAAERLSSARKTLFPPAGHIDEPSHASLAAK